MRIPSSLLVIRILWGVAIKSLLIVLVSAFCNPRITRCVLGVILVSLAAACQPSGPQPDEIFEHASYFKPRSLHQIHREYQAAIDSWASDALLVSAEFGVGDKRDFYLSYTSLTLEGRMLIYDLGNGEELIKTGPGRSLAGTSIGLDPLEVMDSTEIFEIFFAPSLLRFELERTRLAENCSRIRLGYGLSDSGWTFIDISPIEVLLWRLDISDCVSPSLVRDWRLSNGGEFGSGYQKGDE